MKAFKNQIVLVTGGSSGIGLEIARQLSQQGAHIWLLARRKEVLASAVETIKAFRSSPEQRFGMLVADVSDVEQVNAAVQQIVQEIGLPDMVINSAGICEPGYFMDLDLEVLHQEMDINYFGTVYMTKAVLPGMIQRRSGHIVNICSAAAFISVFGYSAYAPTKSAMVAFSDILRSEMKPHGIQVSIVFPADVDTPQLTYETQLQPLETQAMAPFRNVIPSEMFSRMTLKDIARGRYMILPGFDSKILYWLTRVLGTSFYPLFDIVHSIMIRRKLSQVAKNKVR